MAAVLLTRARADNAELAQRLRSLGVGVVELPTAALVCCAPVEGLAVVQAAIGRADFVAFTSRYAVNAAVELELLDVLRGVRVGVVGSATERAVLAAGLLSEVVAQPATGTALAGALADALMRSGAGPGNVVCLQGRHARPELVDGLRQRNILVERFAIYENRVPAPPDELTRIAATGADVVYFAAPSAAERLYDWLPSLRGTPWVAIGATTAAAVASLHGKSAAAVAQSPRLGDVVDAIMAAIRSASPRPFGEDDDRE